jgi:hypothetical protein
MKGLIYTVSIRVELQVARQDPVQEKGSVIGVHGWKFGEPKVILQFMDGWSCGGVSLIVCRIFLPSAILCLNGLLVIGLPPAGEGVREVDSGREESELLYGATPDRAHQR